MSPANREIRVGVVGTDWITRAHVHALHALNHVQPLPSRVRIVSLAGRRAEAVAAMAAELDIESSTTDWRELVERPDIDVIANVGTNALHAPVSLAALAAGKHVLCEKPLATTLEDAARMGQAAASADVRALSDAIYRSARAGRRMEFASADAVA
jgi:predicted dehydrogenase